MWGIMRNALGAVFIIVGIPGLVLPIIQGWLFIAVGALLLSVDVPFFDRLVRWIEGKIPALQKPLERVRNFLKGPEKS